MLPQVRARSTCNRWFRPAVKGLGTLLLGIGTTFTSAATLERDFERAQQHDPLYASAVAENEAGRLQARVASFAYYPEGRFSSSQLDNERGSRVTLALSQPILNYDRWLTLKEVDPRLAVAAAKLEQSQNDLAQRLIKAVATWADAREKITLNRATLTALEGQLKSARRALELGMGTITDVRDTEVRVAQARSQTFALEAALAAAERQYASVVGAKASDRHYRLSEALPMPKLAPLDELLARASERNTAIRGGEQSVTLAQIGVKRAKAALYPSVNFALQRSQISGNAASSSGLAIRMEVPLQAGTYYKGTAAGLDLKRAEEQARNQRQMVALDVERLFSEVRAAQSELAVRREAIQAAELSVEANEQSFKGGFRTRIDVLNAIQAMFQAKADYASTLLRLGESWASLHLMTAHDIDTTLRQVQSYMFLGKP